MKRLFAVLGDRVQRSLSPLLHTEAGLACNIDLAYVPVVCADRAHFHRAVDALRTIGAGGANVTIPYKEEALALCDRMTPTATRIGAINTLTFTESGAVEGTNTDGPALERLFAAMPQAARGRVQILGAGGAARAAAWALKTAGATEVIVTARSPSARSAVAAPFGASASPLGPVPRATMIVSSLPGTPDLAQQILRDWVDVGARPYVYDLAYGSLDSPSPLVEEARNLGLVAADGLSMLVEQAALALSIWTQRAPAPLLRAMKAAVGLPLSDDPFDSDPGAD